MLLALGRGEGKWKLIGQFSRGVIGFNGSDLKHHRLTDKHFTLRFDDFRSGCHISHQQQLFTQLTLPRRSHGYQTIKILQNGWQFKPVKCLNVFSSFFIFTLVNQLVPDPLDVATGQFLIKVSNISFVIKVQLSDLTTKDHHLTMPSSFIGKQCDNSDDFRLRSFWRRSGLAGGSFMDYGVQPFKLWVITLSSWARLFTLKVLVYPGNFNVYRT